MVILRNYVRYLIAVQKYCQLKKVRVNSILLLKVIKINISKKGMHKNKRVIFNCFNQKIRRARREWIDPGCTP
jgi:hypothetical protein